jgi:hypothetical protein
MRRTLTGLGGLASAVALATGSKSGEGEEQRAIVRFAVSSVRGGRPYQEDRCTSHLGMIPRHQVLLAPRTAQVIQHTTRHDTHGHAGAPRTKEPRARCCPTTLGVARHVSSAGSAQVRLSSEQPGGRAQPAHRHHGQARLTFQWVRRGSLQRCRSRDIHCARWAWR